MKNTVNLLLCIFFATNFVAAQDLVTGRVVDAVTGEGLPAAHIIIKNTYSGTIANEHGEFSLSVKAFPAVLVARYMGFETKEIEVFSTDEEVLFALEEAVVQMDELTISAKEDPAVAIMREVIRRKQIWRQNLKTYSVEAYSRQQLRNDTTIVSITESFSDAFWHHEKGPREVLKSKRQTDNMDFSLNFAGVSYLPNFYDDDFDISGFEVVGITHPEALKYYNFKLMDYKSIDDKIVFEIEVTPRRTLQPLFQGTIYVLDEDYALLSVDLTPNQVIVFPPPIQDFNLAYEQQFSNFGGDFWLPVDIRIEGMVKVGMIGIQFPPINVKQVSKLNNYEINVPLPDSLYESFRRISVDSIAVALGDSVFEGNIDPIPLSVEEIKAYEEIDSTVTLEEAFKPKGFLVKFIEFIADDDVSVSTGGSSSTSSSSSSSLPRFGANKISQHTSVIGRFNKVDGIHLGAQFNARLLGNTLEPKFKLARSFGYREWSHGATLKWTPKSLRKNGFSTTLGYDFDTKPTSESDLYDIALVSSLALLGFDDYYDYFRNERAFLEFSFRTRYKRLRYSIGYAYENHKSINFKTDYNILGRNHIQPANPPIEDGQLSAVQVVIGKGSTSNYYGVMGQDGWELKIKQSLKAIGSDWDFTRFSLNMYKRFDTFFQKRFFPNTLDVRFNAGTYLGHLPVQQYGTLDASFGYFTPFGGFKAKKYIPYRGAHYMAVHAEHNFRSIPFEILGWRSAPKTGLSLIAFGGVGKTWTPVTYYYSLFPINNSNSNIRYGINGTDDIHAEVGVSLSNIFNLFRFDLAFRLDEPGIYPGISFARIF